MEDLNNNIEQGQETETEETVTMTKEELNALLQKEGDRRVTQALDKQNKKNAEKLKEAEKLAKMSADEKYAYELEQREKAIVEKEVDSLKKLGVDIKTDVPVGNSITIPELQKEYDAVFLGTGAGLPKFMGIPGEDANGVFSANEILTRINLMGAYKSDSKTPIKNAKKAYIIGGGNVAMDSVRSLKRLGVETHLMYRRSEEELPARKMEVEHAKEEGIIFDLLTNPVEILTDENNNVTGMKVVNMELTEPGEDGRRSVVPKEGSEHVVECDMVVMALGTGPNHEALKNSNIVLTEKGLIEVEGTKTSLENTYAGGDAVTGAATVILAMEAGKKAAAEIMQNI